MHSGVIVSSMRYIYDLEVDIKKKLSIMLGTLFAQVLHILKLASKLGGPVVLEAFLDSRPENALLVLEERGSMTLSSPH